MPSPAPANSLWLKFHGIALGPHMPGPDTKFVVHFRVEALLDPINLDLRVL